MVLPWPGFEETIFSILLIPFNKNILALSILEINKVNYVFRGKKKMYFLATYWLSFEMLHCGGIFRNHTFRKEHTMKGNVMPRNYNRSSRIDPKIPPDFE
jgi:hypothetical protein